MISGQHLDLCTALCEQIKRIDTTSLSFGEFVLHVRSFVAQWQRSLALNGEGVSGAPGKVMLAMVYAAIRQTFPNCDALVENAVEQFVEVKEKEDIVLSLDAIGILPFIMDRFEQHLRDNIVELVEQIACLSAGMTTIMDVCKESMQQTVLRNCAGLSIEPHLRALAHQIATEECIQARFSSLFDLIAIYPDSQPAVRELQGLLEQHRPDLQGLLELSTRSCQEKLLTPAMSTEAILGQFIHGIPVFKSVDPTGLILDRCCLLGKEYLGERRDAELHEAVLRLFHRMADEAELKRPAKFDAKGEEYLDYDDPDTADSWLPDPLAAGKEPVRASSKSFDPFSVLANFSCPDKLFPCLHRSVMDMIANGHTPGSKILKQINLAAGFLFGRAACSSLLVMLHDAQKSHEIFGRNPSYAPLIVSLGYWPVRDATFSDALPGGFPDLQDLATRYSQSCRKRSLRWIPELSCVDMDLVVDDSTYTLNSVPYVAFRAMQGIISGQGTTVFTLSDADKRGLMFWAQQGFLQCSEHGKLTVTKPGAVRVVDMDAFKAFVFESATSKAPCRSNTGNTGNTGIPAHIGAMVTAMLTNLGPLPAAKIHGMLTTMSGLKQSIDSLSVWLHERPDVQFDPVSGLFSRKK